MEDLATALVSPRDGAAYVILYGIEPRQSSPADGQPNVPAAAGTLEHCNISYTETKKSQDQTDQTHATQHTFTP